MPAPPATTSSQVPDETLVKEIVGLVETRWNERSDAMLLTAVATELIKKGIDYRATLGNRSLKAFLLDAAKDKIKIVEDPVHKARIGFVPSYVDYAFPSRHDGRVDVGSSGGSTNRSSGRRSHTALLEFLNALGKLSEEDQNSVVIPTKVLVELTRADR